MFARFGPNARQVEAFLKAIQEATKEEITRIGTVSPNFKNSEFREVIDRCKPLWPDRYAACQAAIEDSKQALGNNRTEIQEQFVTTVAAMLTVSDRLSLHDSLVLTSPIEFALRRFNRYACYNPEDFAIERFCSELSKIEGHEVYVVERPDDRGRNGDGLIDAIISRGGKKFALEHTALYIYEDQKKQDELFDRHVRQLGIAEEVETNYPGYWVRVIFPLEVFDTSKFKFNYGTVFPLLKKSILEEVGKVKASPNCSQFQRFNFVGIPFPVWIARTPFATIYWIEQGRPISRADLPICLDEILAKAIKGNLQKLRDAKQKGENRLLLLEAKTELEITLLQFVESFGRVAVHLKTELRDIDEVFLSNSISALPVKMGSRCYPDLPEFNEYKDKWLALNP